MCVWVCVFVHAFKDVCWCMRVCLWERYSVCACAVWMPASKCHVCVCVCVWVKWWKNSIYALYMYKPQASISLDIAYMFPMLVPINLYCNLITFIYLEVGTNDRHFQSALMFIIMFENYMHHKIIFKQVRCRK